MIRKPISFPNCRLLPPPVHFVSCFLSGLTVLFIISDLFSVAFTSCDRILVLSSVRRIFSFSETIADNCTRVVGVFQMQIGSIVMTHTHTLVCVSTVQLSVNLHTQCALHTRARQTMMISAKMSPDFDQDTTFNQFLNHRPSFFFVWLLILERFVLFRCVCTRFVFNRLTLTYPLSLWLHLPHRLLFIYFPTVSFIQIAIIFIVWIRISFVGVCLFIFGPSAVYVCVCPPVCPLSSSAHLCSVHYNITAHLLSLFQQIALAAISIVTSGPHQRTHIHDHLVFWHNHYRLDDYLDYFNHNHNY